jgi:hypothetical protein
MNENQIGPSNLLDTTDCLEAVGVFKGWKNFFFVIIIICLLLTQVSFWLVNVGWIPIPTASNMAIAGEEIIIRMPVTAELKQNMGQDANEEAQEMAVEPDQPAEADEPEETNQPAESEQTAEANQPVMSEKPDVPNEPAVASQPAVPIQPAVPNEPAVTARPDEQEQPLESKEPEMAAEVESAEPEQTGEKITETVVPEPAMSSDQQEAGGFLFGITFDHLVWIIRFANAVLVLATTLYCLTMLFSLKVSMLGRLGGINHITRAFFLSLLALVLLLPWQRVFSPVVVGAIFTPEEMVERFSYRIPGLFDSIIYYLRFCGFWLLIVLLLVLAQIRSSRWAGAILRRLEII